MILQAYMNLIGLFFGSFNPFHNGHLKIAQYMLLEKYCGQIWFVISPRNPLKKDFTLLDEKKRLEILNAAIAGEPRMIACDIEFNMPRPSYTIDTLTLLSQKWPDKEFVLILGEDNLQNFHLWKDAEKIADHYRMIVYPRKGIDTEEVREGNISVVNAPLADISSTEIRGKIDKKEDISALVPPGSLSFILKYYGSDEE